MDLLDALCSNQHARHVVELSLEPAFRRHYTALFQAIGEYHSQVGTSAHLAPAPKKWAFWPIGVDVTAQPREYAHTLEKRTFVVQAGRHPRQQADYYRISVLHESFAAGEGGGYTALGVPLSCERVPAEKRKAEVGKEQIDALLSDPQMPFHGQLVVEVVDSDYARPDYLAAHCKHPNLVTMERARSNRVFYRQKERRAAETGGAPGHCGTAFGLRDPATWQAPDATLELPFVRRRGKHYLP